MMKNNVGSPDRIARALAGGGLALAELSGYLGAIEQVVEIATLAMALFLLTTGFSGRCPTYTVFGISTCSNEDEEE